jgi:hypothetical protein
MNHPSQKQPAKSVRFLLLVEEECRRMGGKHLLTRDEYLQIINACYRQIYGTEPIDEDDLPASVV